MESWIGEAYKISTQKKPCLPASSTEFPSRIIVPEKDPREVVEDDIVDKELGE
jgi:hypothetical protein